MNDKLLELQGMRNKANGGAGAQPANQNKMELSSNNQQSLFPGFQDKVVRSKRLIEGIRMNNTEISTLKDSYQRAPTSSQEKAVSQELESLIMKNNRSLKELSDIMQYLATEVENSQQNEPGDSETINKTNIFKGLQSNVQDLATQCQEAQTEYKLGVKNKLQRQTKYLDANLTEKEVQEIVDDPQKAQQLLQSKLYGQASTQLQNAVSDIQDKYRDIKKLEKSIAEVHQMFLDMALLVHQQGEILDDIEANIVSAEKNVVQGNKNLDQAKKHHQSSKKKMCCILMILLGIILVIVIPVVVSKK